MGSEMCIRDSPDTDELLHKLLEMLAQKGEDETFSYIKKELLTKKGY